MPTVVADQIKRFFVHSNFSSYLGKDLFLVKLDKIAEKYMHFCDAKVSVYAYLSRIFNEKL